MEKIENVKIEFSSDDNAIEYLKNKLAHLSKDGLACLVGIYNCERGNGCDIETAANNTFKILENILVQQLKTVVEGSKKPKPLSVPPQNVTIDGPMERDDDPLTFYFNLINRKFDVSLAPIFTVENFKKMQLNSRSKTEE